jgi:stage II sporulation protein D
MELIRIAGFMRRRLLSRLVVLGAFGVLIFNAPGGSAQSLSSGPTIRIGVLQNGSYEVVTLPLEVYVARVLTGEALPGSAPAAMESLAIAIRTYTIANMGRHQADGFDLCDQTHCQVMREATPVTEAAARATAGQILLFHGTPATIYYSASCGGHTELPSNVWPGAEDPPYLPSREDDGCEGAPEWSTELSRSDLQRALRAAGFLGTLQDMRIASRNESGRAQQLTLEGLTPSQISGQDLRAAVGRTLGWQFIQSTSFELTRSGDFFRLRGHGAGHGVGMCVIGSSRLAARGRTAGEILAQYFPGTDIGIVAPRQTETPAIKEPTGAGRSTAAAAPERAPAAAVAAPPAVAPAIASPSAAPPPIAPPAPAAAAHASQEGITVSLPDIDAGERDAIAALVARERDDIARTLGVTAPAKIAVRIHDSSSAYQQATDRPWYTLGAVVSGEMHLVPLPVLRQRGVLERTVRHELVHVMADAAFAGRLAWVREGAAIHFSEGTNGPPPSAACPLDNELLRPASIGALSNAYARARACFERQLTSGRKWSEIR